ncbi:DUF2950 domain-containing protein [Paraburkholderia jirisanensis]
MKLWSRFPPGLLSGLSHVAAVVCLCGAASLSTAHAEQNFSTPQAAMDAFGDAVINNQEGALQSIFGRDFRQLIPPVDAQVRSRFIDEWGISHTVHTVDATHARIAVGDDGWTLPIPLVKSAHGWHFDTHAGVEEMRVRRIGRNELAVIQAMLAVYDAQREYASTDHNGDGLLAYASKLSSSPGKQDGLYWPTQADEPPSPLGAAFIKAGTRKTADAGYHGYHYKLLTSQGSHAPGGAYDYMTHGRLFGGFAVIAWPVRYDDTGIKTFMVSHAGQVYERDLGPDGAAIASAMKSFDPGPGWTKVAP